MFVELSEVSVVTALDRVKDARAVAGLEELGNQPKTLGQTGGGITRAAILDLSEFLQVIGCRISVQHAAGDEGPQVISLSLFVLTQCIGS